MLQICQERYVTLGAGHTVAFCKVASTPEAPTPEKGLADALGRIDLGKLKAQPNMRQMVEVGWTWKVISSEVDETAPNLLP